MSRRRATLVLVCEDGQHEAFMRRFFMRAGWHPRTFRVEKSPTGRGAGEQWVRERFPSELAAMRRRAARTALAAMVDADRTEMASRLNAFDGACVEAGVPVRNPQEPVAIFVPKRNIETWIAWLDGGDVDEVSTYPRLSRERDCVSAVRALWEMCRVGALRPSAPPSMEDACTEFRNRLANVED